MTEASESLRRLAAAMASGDESVLAVAMRQASQAADRTAAEEVLLQGYLFLGYPAVLRALALWRGIVGSSEATAAPDESREAWRERGERVCARIYGGAYEQLRQNVAALHPDLERWMVEEGYGKVLGRPGLDLPERELCVIALLAGLPAPHQLHSHMRGALNAGAAPADVDEALDAAAQVLSADRIMAARELWKAVRGRWLQRRAVAERVSDPEEEGAGSRDVR